MSQSPLSSSKFASPGAPEASPGTSPNPSVSAQDAPASAQNAAQALQIDNKKSTSTRVKTTLPSRLTWDDQGAMSRLARFLTPPMLLAVIVAVT